MSGAESEAEATYYSGFMVTVEGSDTAWVGGRRVRKCVRVKKRGGGDGRG
jgi:hypothetical protein